jgi:hypothetical protein
MACKTEGTTRETAYGPLAVGLALTFAIGCGAAKDAGYAPSGLRLEPDSIDLGRVALFEPRTFEARLTNESGETVSLEKPASDCICAALELGDLELAPGEATTRSRPVPSRSERTSGGGAFAQPHRAAGGMLCRRIASICCKRFCGRR